MTLWIFASAGLHLLVYSVVGPRARGVVLASWFALGVAPALSTWMYPNVAYNRTTYLTELFTLGILAPVLLSGRPQRDAVDTPLESRVAVSRRLLPLLFVGLVVVLVANVLMYQIILGGRTVTSLYDLNVVMSSRDLPSLGIAGRLSRLAMPLGLLAFVSALLTNDTRQKRRLLIFALVFALTLVGVRRAVFFYEICFYFLAWLILIRGERRTLRRIIRLAFFATAALAFFGWVQVATKKASGTSVLGSAVHDALLYVAGNLPYAECLESTGRPLPKGISFPFLFNGLLRGDGPRLSKPFCTLPDGRLFNTSPGYYDVWSDFGYIGLIVSALIVGLLVAACIRGRLRLVGFEAVILSVIVFSCRENILGSLDVIQCLILYPIFARMSADRGARPRAPRSLLREGVA